MNNNDPDLLQLKQDIVEITNRSFNNIEEYGKAMMDRIQEEIKKTVVKTEAKYNDMEKRLKIVETRLGIRQWYDE